ncbi:MAG: L,D-transpeptidase [Candidatus Saccharibacteria bacterium]|nr:L,D-transpeptidase [Microbacteriaceae bacterium]
MISPRLVASFVGTIVALLLLSGCGSVAQDGVRSKLSASPTRPSTSPIATPVPPVPAAVTPVGTAATATTSRTSVYVKPGGAVKLSLANPRPSGGPLTFLVVQSTDGWLEVNLPDRPNGSRGWINAAAVSLHGLEYNLRVSTEQNTLTLYRNNVLEKTYSVATGTGGTPSPHGSFYLTELLAPTNAGYGPYAFGLSAYSEVLTSFGGGPGQIGLHGTEDSASIGRSASHGCIRMTNADITALAAKLPLGTPITIE